MPVQCEWYIPNQVIDVRLQGEITVEDVQNLAQIWVIMLTEAQNQVPGKNIYLLYDTLEVITMPPVYLMLPQALPVLRFKNRGPMLHITRNRTIRSIIDLSAHITKFQLYSFETRKEALTALDAMMIKEGLPSIRE